MPWVHAFKIGTREMNKYQRDLQAIRAVAPNKALLTCHDEYLLPTMFDVDGLLVGYGNIAPELLVELIDAGKAHDYDRAHAIHEKLLPVTKNVAVTPRSLRMSSTSLVLVFQPGPSSNVSMGVSSRRKARTRWGCWIIWASPRRRSSAPRAGG